MVANHGTNLILVFCCVIKLPVGSIQIGNMDLPPPAGLRKVVDKVLVGCSYLFTKIDCFDCLKYVSRSSTNTFFVDY